MTHQLIASPYPEGHVVVRPPDLADLAGGRLEVIFHDDAEPLAPRFLGERGRAVFAAQEFRPDMHMHIDDAFAAKLRKRSHCLQPMR